MRYRRNVAFTALTVAIGLAAPRSQALAQSGACKMGARVTDRENRTGTVVEATGADCRVRLADGTVRYYLAWMLSAAGGDSAKTIDAAGLATGTYACLAAGGTAGTLRLVIKGKTEYADRSGKTGKYTFDVKTGDIVFDTGAWAGFFGKKLGPEKIGISSRRGGFMNTVCDLQRPR